MTSNKVEKLTPVEIKINNFDDIDGIFAVVVDGGKVGPYTPTAYSNSGDVIRIEPKLWKPHRESTDTNFSSLLVPLSSWEDARADFKDEIVVNTIEGALAQSYLAREDLNEEIGKAFDDTGKQLLDEIKESVLYCNTCGKPAISLRGQAVNTVQMTLIVIQVSTPTSLGKFLLEKIANMPIITNHEDVIIKVLEYISTDAGSGAYELCYDEKHQALRHTGCPGPESEGEIITSKNEDPYFYAIKKGVRGSC